MGPRFHPDVGFRLTCKHKSRVTFVVTIVTTLNTGLNGDLFEQHRNLISYHACNRSIAKITSSKMDEFEFPPFPPPLACEKTYVYKQVRNTLIELDVHLPKEAVDPSRDTPVLVFIHGGGWIGGHRTEYCRPLFEEFLSRGFVVVSVDYRLLPESEFIHGQLEDIRDVETWIRTDYRLNWRKMVLG